MMSMIESGSGGVSFGAGNDPVEDNAIEQQLPPVKKQRLHRHTPHQIQEMEALFKDNPHPDNDQKLRLSQELGLTPLQIKFWFQNKRTQTKAQQERKDNVMLKAENNTLKTEHDNLQSNLECLFCPSCDGSSGYKLRLENSRLRQQLVRLRRIASLANSPPLKDTACFFPDAKNTDISLAEEEKAIAMDLAVSCGQELVKMCETNEPLWIKKRSEDESVCLNEEEYTKMFNNGDNGSRFRREASRANAVVILNSISLVNAFLDADRWSEMFSSIVARAKTIQIISSGVYGASGSLLLMNAELQVLSPLVSTREAYFLRYVEQNAEEGKWMIVDFPIDMIKPISATTNTDQYRRPSGCIIQEMANGYSQVTWIEHLEVEEKHVQHEAVREYVKSGAAFGAKRWLDVLRRQCERMASFMATNITDLGVIPSVEARRNLMKLSQTMVRTFCLNISDSKEQALSESTLDTVRITTRRVCSNLVPCAVSTTFLPYSHRQVFDLLRDNQRRSQLKILFNEDSLQEVAHIATGSHPGNCISLLRNNVAKDSLRNVKLMLQETCTDNSGSLVVYSTVDASAVHLAMNSEDLSNIQLLPHGFAVIPLNPSDGMEGGACLLTVAIQVTVSNVATARLDLSTVDAVNNCICSTVTRITSVLGSSSSSVVVIEDSN